MSATPWLVRLFTLFLIVWEPVTFAVTASSALTRLLSFGWPALVLAVYRALVVGLGIAAGLALRGGRHHGFDLARVWAVLHAAAVALTFSTPYFPSNRTPGTKAPTLVALLLFDASLFIWLWWSARVRRGGDD